MSDSVKVMAIPPCDLCKEPAEYDARLVHAGGTWAYVCQRHFDELGPGRLGTGHAQKLVLR